MQRSHPSEKKYILDAYNLIKDIELPEEIDCFDGVKRQENTYSAASYVKEIKNIKTYLETILAGFEKKDEELAEQELNSLIGTYGKVNIALEQFDFTRLLAEYKNDPSFEKVDHPTFEKLEKANRTMEQLKSAWSLRHANNQLDECRGWIVEDQKKRDDFNKKFKAFYKKNPNFNYEIIEKEVNELDKKIMAKQAWIDKVTSAEALEKKANILRNAKKSLAEGRANILEIEKTNEKEKQLLEEIDGFEITVRKTILELFNMDKEINEVKVELDSFMEQNQKQLQNQNQKKKGKKDKTKNSNIEIELKTRVDMLQSYTERRNKISRDLGAAYHQHFVIKGQLVEDEKQELIRGEDNTPEKILEELAHMKKVYQERTKTYYDRKAAMQNQIDKAEETIQNLKEKKENLVIAEKLDLEKEKAEWLMKKSAFDELHQEFLSLQKNTADLAGKVKEVQENAGQSMVFKKEAIRSLNQFHHHAMDGKKPDHKDSPEFNAMVDALDKNVYRLEAVNEKEFGDLIKNIKDAAQNYLNKKNEQIRPWASKQRKVRLEYAKSLVEMCDHLTKENKTVHEMSKEFDSFIKKGDKAKHHVVALQDVKEYHAILTGNKTHSVNYDRQTNKLIEPINKEAIIQL